MRVISVFGPFNSRTLVEMSTEDVEQLIGHDLDAARPAYLIDATTREIDRIREIDADLADSPLAAAALAMAYEIANPFNSATSKSMCAGKLQDALRELRSLMPPEEVEDGVDELSRRREDRERERAGASASANLPRP